MPIYEYRCNKCSSDFEELILSKDEEVLCPGCGTSEVARKLSVCSFRSGGSSGAELSGGTSAGSACSGCAATSCATCK